MPTVSEIAQILGVSTGRIRQMIYAGQLPAHKIGNQYVVAISDARAARRPNGRPRSVKNKRLVIYCDGAAWNNPDGPGGWGFVVYSVTCRRKQKRRLFYRAHGGMPAPTTNNEAEYEAVEQALRWLKRAPGKAQNVEIFSDSDLIVNQISGHYNCKAEHLEWRRDRCRGLLADLTCPLIIDWIPREENASADREAAAGIAEMLGLPLAETWARLEERRAYYAARKANERKVTAHALKINQQEKEMAGLFARLKTAEKAGAA